MRTRAVHWLSLPDRYPEAHTWFGDTDGAINMAEQAIATKAARIVVVQERQGDRCTWIIHHTSITALDALGVANEAVIADSGRP